MSNIYRNSEEKYFQLSKHVVEAGILKQWSQASQTLYTYLLYVAQERSSPTVALDTVDVIKNTGLSKYKRKIAREELFALKLVRSSEIQSGTWLYEISVKRNYQDVDFNTLTREELEPWFLARLDDPVYGHQQDDNGLRVKCPFCQRGKRKEFPLSIKLVEDHVTGLGAWHCFMCLRSGKLVELEQQLARRKGEQIDINEAHDRVAKSLLQYRQAKEDEVIRTEALKMI